MNTRITYYLTPAMAACVALMATLSGAAVADAAADTEAIEKSPSSSLDIYCGLNTVYTLLRMTGQDVEFTSLLKPEYLGSQKGSSLAELSRAAEDHGLSALATGALTVENLEGSEYPMVLHVKRTPYSSEFDHYELFLGVKQGKAVLYDPPNAVRQEALHELMPRWDGTALILAATPIDQDAVFWPARRKNILLLLGALVVIFGIRAAARSVLALEKPKSARQRLALSALQSTGFVAGACVCGLLFHLLSDKGLLAHAETENQARAANFDSFLKIVDKEATRDLLNTSAVFIDARMSQDYQRDHLEGAINIEPRSSVEFCKEALAGVDTATPIVLYCQSAGCPYAGKVARLLSTLGYENLMHYKGGWNDWETAQ